MVELAAALDAGPSVVRDALGAGAVAVEQAQVISAAVAALPAEVGPVVAEKAATALVGFAGDYEPAILRRLGEQILLHVAPEVADEIDRAALGRAERRAHRDRFVALTDTGDEAVRLTGRLDAEAAATVRAALDPLCTPIAGDERSAGQRRADALVEVCRLALHSEERPEHGGDRAQVVVTVGLDPLTRELGAGLLDTGDRLTPDTVRRMACDARVLPAALDGAGQPLDLGRDRRLFTGPLRRALVLRDGGCAFPGRNDAVLPL